MQVEGLITAVAHTVSNPVPAQQSSKTTEIYIHVSTIVFNK